QRIDFIDWENPEDDLGWLYDRFGVDNIEALHEKLDQEQKYDVADDGLHMEKTDDGSFIFWEDVPEGELRVAGFFDVTIDKFTSVKIKSQPAKTVYTEGESFDKSGMKVVACDDDGEEVDVTSFVTLTAAALRTSDTKVTVSYEGLAGTLTAECPVTVVPVPTPSPSVTPTVSADPTPSPSAAPEVKKTNDSVIGEDGSVSTLGKANADGSYDLTYTPGEKAKNSSSVTVQASVMVNGVSCPVTAIAANAFKGSKVTSVKLPASVIQIGSGAFANCPKLKTITLGSKTVKIAKNAFKGSKNIKTVIFTSPKVPSKKDIKGVKSLGKKVIIKVPKKLFAKYMSVLKAAGFKGTVKKK
ncbi:MAG: leucine-rich repeat protein, partial [Lachnospiraceae bacterium]|nr:leucine-rich repeat protein [Lachnospiraceae bacterium]